MKTVLIISYYFPPDPAIGGLRIKGLAENLHEYGWNPIILTKKIPVNPCVIYNIVTTPYSEHDRIGYLKEKIGMDKRVGVMTQLGINSNWDKKTLKEMILNLIPEILAYPDSQKGWHKCAYKECENVLKNEKIDAIISSAMPITCHLVANDLKMKYNIPWIADFRDLWTQNPYRTPYSPIRNYFEKRLEIKTFEKADSLTTVSKHLAESLRLLHGKIPVYSILNGFDIKEANTCDISLTDKFTITYTGSFYEGKRDPGKFFQGLQELISEKVFDSDNVEVRFYGPQDIWLQKKIESYHLEEIVNCYGIVPREVSLEKQRDSQLLLLLLWDHPDEIGVYTGKLFEYLAAKRPILAIGGERRGVVEELLEETEAGKYASSVESLKSILTEYYNEYKLNSNLNYQGNKQKVDMYSQKEMAKKFAVVLDEIVES
jgi:hypothetical protein